MGMNSLGIEELGMSARVLSLFWEKNLVQKREIRDFGVFSYCTGPPILWAESERRKLTISGDS
jgi:hypothetical protein